MLPPALPAVGSVMLALIAGTAAAQAPPDARSTRAGVYTVEQAETGAEVYQVSCANCHPPITHTGPAFVAKWTGRPLSALFAYISGAMPKNEPGTLTESEYVVVLAYLLKMNGLPAGSTQLAADPSALKLIRTEFPTSDSTHQQ
jgi:mono/diheme cytochrome c family protein